MRNTRTRLLNAAAAMASTVFLLVCTGVPAQGTKPAAATAPATAAAPATAPAAKPFKEEELASLLAPIALYPDTVVAQILMASTYPLEVIEARRWVEKNTQLKGDALATEAKKQSWDQSVQALTALPDVLKMMDEKLDWMQKLGDAFLAQQTEVMAMVQTLRKKAKDSGNLKSDEHQTVKVEPAPADHGGCAEHDDDHHRANRSGGDLRPNLQPDGRLWILGLSGLSAVLLLSAGLLPPCLRLLVGRRRRNQHRNLGRSME